MQKHDESTYVPKAISTCLSRPEGASLPSGTADENEFFCTSVCFLTQYVPSSFPALRSWLCGWPCCPQMADQEKVTAKKGLTAEEAALAMATGQGALGREPEEAADDEQGAAVDQELQV